MFFGHNFGTRNPSKSSKVSKDSDFCLVSNKNLSEALPSSSLDLGPDGMGQIGLKLLHLWRHSQKNWNPPNFFFFYCRCEDLPSLLRVWNLFFFGHRLKRFWNDWKKLSHLGQNVWKYRLKTLLWWVLIQPWEVFQWPKFLRKKWPKCFSKKKCKWKSELNEKNLTKASTWKTTLGTCVLVVQTTLLDTTPCKFVYCSKTM